MLNILFYILKLPRAIRAILLYPIYPLLRVATKSKVKARIHKALPLLSDDQVNQIVSKTIRINFENVIHILGIPEENYQFHGLEDLLDCQAAVVATMHSGKTDAATWALQSKGINTLTIIGEARKKPKAKAFGINLLNHLNINYVVRKRGLVFQLLSELKKNKVVFVHSDFRGEGPKVEFFGRQTTVPGTAASLSVLASVPLFFIYTVNDIKENHIYIKRIDMPDDIKSQKNKSIDYLTQKIANEMESAIRDFPEQWFWFYNRFK